MNLCGYRDNCEFCNRIVITKDYWPIPHCGCLSKEGKKVCPVCNGDGFHPMANYPRNVDTLKGNECSLCKGTKCVTNELYEKYARKKV